MLEGLEKELAEEEGKEDETEDVCTELFDLNLPQQLKSGLETDFANISGSFTWKMGVRLYDIIWSKACLINVGRKGIWSIFKMIF